MKNYVIASPMSRAYNVATFFMQDRLAVYIVLKADQNESTQSKWNKVYYIQNKTSNTT